MQGEPFGGDRDIDTTSADRDEHTIVSGRMPRPAVPVAGAPSEDTDGTVRVDRAATPSGVALPVPPEGDEDTVVGARPRAARVPDDATLRVHRSSAAVKEIESDAAASPLTASGRVAYSPDPAALAEGYSARPAAPFITGRAGHPLRMAQPQIDGEAIDRSIRGKAQRRVMSVGVAIAFAVVSGGCLLVALIASFAH